MVDLRREEQTKNAPRETRGKTDVSRAPETQHELNRSARTSDITQRNLGRSPFAMMNVLHQEVDRLFEDFGFGGSLFRAPRMSRDLWSPRIETYERDNKLHIAADLPGLSKDDIKIELLDNLLTIEGERKHEQRDEQGGWSERSYGRFFRSIPLPEGINAETANANFENGVLEVIFDMPKTQQRQGKQIAIGGKR